MGHQHISLSKKKKVDVSSNLSRVETNFSYLYVFSLEFIKKRGTEDIYVTRSIFLHRFPLSVIIYYDKLREVILSARAEMFYEDNPDRISTCNAERHDDGRRPSHFDGAPRSCQGALNLFRGWSASENIPRKS